MSTFWVFLLLSTVCNTTASILVKMATLVESTSKLSVYFSWQFVISILLFGSNLIFYTQAIKKIPLYIAYPFVVGITIISITLFSFFYLNEKIQMYEFFAIFLILSGITILSK